jgi:hypothetical protein
VRMSGVYLFYTVRTTNPSGGMMFIFNMMFVEDIKYWILKDKLYFIYLVALLASATNMQFSSNVMASSFCYLYYFNSVLYVSLCPVFNMFCSYVDVSLLRFIALTHSPYPD